MDMSDLVRSMSFTKECYPKLHLYVTDRKNTSNRLNSFYAMPIYKHVLSSRIDTYNVEFEHD